MLHIVLIQPDIPQNTGNIGRTCAITGSRLHLVHPLGFQISEKRLRRAGMDYWNALEVYEHKSWAHYLDSDKRPVDEKHHLFTTHASTSLWETSILDGDALVFGRESAGAPKAVQDWCKQSRVKIPHFTNALRSLNLATSVGIATYEGLRQINGGLSPNRQN